MLDYRLYFVGANGRIERGETFTASDDEDAKRRAAAIARGVPYELWCGARLVEQNPPARR